MHCYWLSYHLVVASTAYLILTCFNLVFSLWTDSFLFLRFLSYIQFNNKIKLTYLFLCQFAKKEKYYRLFGQNFRAKLCYKLPDWLKRGHIKFSLLWSHRLFTLGTPFPSCLVDPWYVRVPNNEQTTEPRGRTSRWPGTLDTHLHRHKYEVIKERLKRGFFACFKSPLLAVIASAIIFKYLPLHKLTKSRSI